MSFSPDIFLSSKFNELNSIFQIDDLASPTKDISKKYQVLATLKELQKALDSKKPIDLTNFEISEVWQNLLNTEETCNNELSEQQLLSFKNELTQKINDLAKALFKLESSLYLEPIGESIKKFPKENSDDIKALIWVLQKIYENDVANAIKNFRPDVKYAAEELVNLYKNDSLCVTKEIFELYQKGFREIAHKTKGELENKKDFSKLLEFKPIVSKPPIVKREVKINNLEPTLADIKHLCPDADDLQLENLKLMFRYLKENGYQFEEFAKKDKEVRDLFIKEMGQIVDHNVPEIGLYCNGALSDLFGKGVVIEHILDIETEKAKLILTNVENVIRLCSHPIEISYSSLISLPISNIEIFVNNTFALKNLKLESRLPIKFLTILPYFYLEDIFSKNDKIFALLNFLEDNNYFEAFKELPESAKNKTLNPDNYFFVTYLANLKVSLSIITEYLNSEYDKNDYQNKFTIYAPFIHKAFQLGISARTICQNLKEKFVFYHDPENLEKLMNYVRGEPNTKFESIVTIFNDQKEPSFGEIVLLFDFEKLELVQIAKIPVERFQILKQISIKFPDFLKKIGPDRFEFLIKYTNEIEFFLDQSKNEKAIFNLDDETCKLLVKKYQSIQNDLNTNSNASGTRPLKKRKFNEYR